MKLVTRTSNFALLFGAALALGACSMSTEDQRTAGQAAVAAAGTALEGAGPCAAVTQIDGDCPVELAWDEHGQYVSCVARYLEARVDAGDLTEEEKGQLVAVAARAHLPHLGPIDPPGGMGGARPDLDIPHGPPQPFPGAAGAPGEVGGPPALPGSPFGSVVASACDGDPED